MTKYVCILHGGSIGESQDFGKVRVFNTKEEAQAHGKSWVRSFGGGHRSYYHPRYNVRAVKETEETRGRISWMGVEFNL